MLSSCVKSKLDSKFKESSFTPFDMVVLIESVTLTAPLSS